VPLRLFSALSLAARSIQFFSERDATAGSSTQLRRVQMCSILMRQHRRQDSMLRIDSSLLGMRGKRRSGTRGNSAACPLFWKRAGEPFV
jgi:hypothetical protein